MASSMLRRAGALLSSAVVGASLTTAIVVAPVSAKVDRACRVTVAGVRYVTVQAAVDAALPGDTLTVRGRCNGPATIDKTLRLVGVSSHAHGPATLHGSPSADVLTVQSYVTLTVRGLAITHGSRGIFMSGQHVLVTLRDSSIVHNGGGIGVSAADARVILRDSSIAHNDGYGIIGFRPEVILDGGSSIDHNTDCGAFVTEGSVILNDSSSIHHNGVAPATGPGQGCGVMLESSSVTLNDRSSIHHNVGSGVNADDPDESGRVYCNDRSSIRRNLYGIYGQSAHWRGCVAGQNVYANALGDIVVPTP